MAIKTFYATRDLKNPSYGTRMLKAGDPVQLDAPKARLYLALGAVSPRKPATEKVAAAQPVIAAAEGEAVTIEVAPNAPAKRNAAPRKRAVRKAK